MLKKNKMQRKNDLIYQFILNYLVALNNHKRNTRKNYNNLNGF